MSLDELILGRINRCDQQKCPLYEAVKDVMNAFGPANFKT